MEMQSIEAPRPVVLELYIARATGELSLTPAGDLVFRGEIRPRGTDNGQDSFLSFIRVVRARIVNGQAVIEKRLTTVRTSSADHGSFTLTAKGVSSDHYISVAFSFIDEQEKPVSPEVKIFRIGDLLEE